MEEQPPEAFLPPFGATFLGPSRVEVLVAELLSMTYSEARTRAILNRHCRGLADDLDVPSAERPSRARLWPLAGRPARLADLDAPAGRKLLAPVEPSRFWNARSIDKQIEYRRDAGSVLRAELARRAARADSAVQEGDPTPLP